MPEGRTQAQDDEGVASGTGFIGSLLAGSPPVGGESGSVVDESAPAAEGVVSLVSGTGGGVVLLESGTEGGGGGVEGALSVGGGVSNGVFPAGATCSTGASAVWSASSEHAASRPSDTAAMASA